MELGEFSKQRNAIYKLFVSTVPNKQAHWFGAVQSSQ